MGKQRRAAANFRTCVPLSRRGVIHFHTIITINVTIFEVLEVLEVLEVCNHNCGQCLTLIILLFGIPGTPRYRTALQHLHSLSNE